MFKRIIVPLDGSMRAERAIPIAARIARASGGVVILLRVVTTPLELGSQFVSSSGFAASTLEVDIEAARKYIAALAGSDDLEGVGIRMRVLPGSPAQTILNVAKEEQADLIVMCSHGDTGFKRWLIGSVAQKVARQSPVPVLVLGEHGSAPTSSYPDRLRPLRTVMALVALDGSALAEAALMPAASLVEALAAPARGSLLLTRVVKLPVAESKGSEYSHGEAFDLQAKENAIHEAKMYLGDVADRLRHGPLADLDLTVTWSVAAGKDVAETLIRAAETGEDAEGTRPFGGCDLVVLATHGRGGLERWMLGSVTERILGATKLPLLIVRPHEQPASTLLAAAQGEAKGS